MLTKLSKNHYKLNMDLKDRVDKIIIGMTTLHIDTYSTFINEVLLETILPRVVVDIIYNQIDIKEKTHINVTYGDKSYNVLLIEKSKELGGVVYNLIT